MKTTGEDIFKALENVDEHYIEECQQSGSGVKIKTVWKKWAAVAACGVIATVTGVMMFAGKSDKDIKTGPAAGSAQKQSNAEAYDEVETGELAHEVPWEDLPIDTQYEFIKYNGTDYSSMAFLGEKYLGDKLETQTLKAINTDTNEQETTKADIYSIKGLSEDVFLAVKFKDGTIAWYEAFGYDPMYFDTMVKDINFCKTAKVQKIYNDVGQGKLRSYSDVDMGKLLDVLKDENGNYAGEVIEESDDSVNYDDIHETPLDYSTTEDNDWYVSNGITVYFNIDMFGIEGQIAFTHNGYVYYEANFGGNKKFYIGSEKVTEIEKWLNENCEYTDVDKNDHNVYDDDSSEKAVTSVAKDDSDMADEVDIEYIDPDNIPDYAIKKSDGWYDIIFEDVGDNTFTTKDGRLTAKYSYEVSGRKFISHITYTNNWDKDMVLDFTTDQYITIEDSSGNATSYGEKSDRNTQNTLLKAGESYTEDYETDIGADYVKRTAKITLIANTASDKNDNVVNYVSLKDIEIDF